MIQHIKRSSFFQKLISKNHEFLLALWPCLLILRASIPGLEYLFIFYSLLYLPVLLYTVFKNKSYIRRISFEVLKDLLIPFGIVALFFFAFMLTDKYSFLVIRQLMVSVYMLFYLIFLKIILNSEDSINEFFNHLFKVFIYISIFSAILGIIKYLFQISDVYFSFLFTSNDFYPIGTTLKSDHNFNSLVYIIGGIILYFLNKTKVKRINYLLFFSVFLILFFAVAFSSSRRSIVLLFVLFIIIVFQAFIIPKEIYRSVRIERYFIRSIVICFLLFAVIFLFIRQSSPTKFFLFKQQSTYIFSDYLSVINPRQLEYNKAYKLLWGEDYIESKQLYSNDQSILMNNGRFTYLERTMVPWESLRRTQVVVDTLNIIKAEGYQSDAVLHIQSGVDSLIDTVYASAYLKINKFYRQPTIELRDGQNRHIKRATTYNDGKWHYIEIKAPNYSNSLWLLVSCRGESVFNPSEYLFYDIKVSGNRELVREDQEILDALNNTSFPDLIDPSAIDTIINLDTISIISHSNLFYKYDLLRMNHYLVSNGKPGVAQTRKIRIPISQKWTFYVRSASNSHNELPRLKIRNLANRQVMYSTVTSYGKWNNYKIDFFADKGDEIEIDFEHFISDGCQISIWNSFALFNSGNSDFKYPDISEIDSSLFIAVCDSIKHATKFIQNISQNKKIDYDNSFFAPRLDRWAYAFALFSENSIFEKIFGEGFDYIDDYSNRYELVGADYPHNVFLSVLLSSGLIGLLFFIYFLIDVSKRYIRSKEWMFFIIFLITFFYMIFSGDTIFELPLLTFFMFLPYVFKINNLKTT